jgi:hypothetical protein
MTPPNENLQQTEMNEDKICPDCKSPNIQWGGSCPLCLECGWSKCQ